MTTASQTPGPMPPESPPAATPEQARATFAAYGVVVPVPVGTMYTDPWPPNGGHESLCAYAGGISRNCTCPDGEPPVAEVRVSVEEAAAAEVLDAVRAQNAEATSLDLAAAAARAGILFDATHVQEAVDAAAAQARAETQAELNELHTQLATLAGDHRRVQAVLRLCEGRRGDDMLLVSAVAVAAECGTTALDGLPMTLTWTGRAEVHPTRGRASVECTSSYGGRADLVLGGEERAALAGLLVVDQADDLDARYGVGASDEYALQVAEATEAGFEDERGDVDEAAGGAV
ncbi:hypothetical protein [Streptomyces sp. NPDC051665]|uniref:hypothetical protein n=1 Tax=Streptomyces sp. NPDC051665 TaxID=3154647 RepID=UPI003432E286